MDDFSLARALHILAVVFWIGGVGFVTLVVIPSIKANTPSSDRLATFHRIEGRFSWQARLWVLLAGASGFWMVYRADLWSRFVDAGFWWMHAMVGLWLLFATILFVIEPFFAHRRMKDSPDPAADFRRLDLGHRVLLTLAVATVIGAAGGARGLF